MLFYKLILRIPAAVDPKNDRKPKTWEQLAYLVTKGAREKIKKEEEEEPVCDAGLNGRAGLEKSI